MLKHYTYSQLNKGLKQQYKQTVRSSFPDIIFQSEVVQKCWNTIEEYFPEFQLFFVNKSGNLIGFINTIPLYWDKPLNELPNEGWDWLVQKGIQDYENQVKPNCLGGLQIIVSKHYLGKGYSKLLIAEGKKIKDKLGFKNFIIPIRPTFKNRYPEVKMSEYINFKRENKIYDPWIRTHLSSGAKVIKVCNNSMYITGKLKYWEGLVKHKINKTGYCKVEGALNPVFMNVEKNQGEYCEANIWINHK